MQIDAKRSASVHGTAPGQRIPQNIRASESPSALRQGAEQADGRRRERKAIDRPKKARVRVLQ